MSEVPLYAFAILAAGVEPVVGDDCTKAYHMLSYNRNVPNQGEAAGLVAPVRHVTY